MQKVVDNHGCCCFEWFGFNKVHTASSIFDENHHLLKRNSEGQFFTSTKDILDSRVNNDLKVVIHNDQIYVVSYDLITSKYIN